MEESVEYGKVVEIYNGGSKLKIYVMHLAVTDEGIYIEKLTGYLDQAKVFYADEGNMLEKALRATRDLFSFSAVTIHNVRVAKIATVSIEDQGEEDDNG